MSSDPAADTDTRPPGPGGIGAVGSARVGSAGVGSARVGPTRWDRTDLPTPLDRRIGDRAELRRRQLNRGGAVP
jgi:hypothetical protein